MSRTSLGLVGGIAGLVILLLVGTHTWRSSSETARDDAAMRSADRRPPRQLLDHDGTDANAWPPGRSDPGKAHPPGADGASVGGREHGSDAGNREEAARRSGAQVVTVPGAGGGPRFLPGHEPGSRGDGGFAVDSLNDTTVPNTGGSHGPVAHVPGQQAQRAPEPAPADSTHVVEEPPATPPGAEDGVVLDLPLAEGKVANGDTPTVADGVTFDSHGATFSTDSQFAVPNSGNIKGEAGTISFWIQPQWGGSDDLSASLVQLRTEYAWSDRIQIVKAGQGIRYIFTPDSGIEAGVSSDISNWEPNEWHQVTTTWEGGVTAMYIDGQLAGAKEYQGQFKVNPATSMLIGSDYPYDYHDNYGAAAGTMSQFKVYNRALSPEEVMQGHADVPQ